MDTGKQALDCVFLGPPGSGLVCMNSDNSFKLATTANLANRNPQRQTGLQRSVPFGAESIRTAWDLSRQHRPTCGTGITFSSAHIERGLIHQSECFKPDIQVSPPGLGSDRDTRAFNLIRPSFFFS